MNTFETSWLRAWAQLGLEPPPGLYHDVLVAYQQPQRHYHTLQHLRECLLLFASVSHGFAHPGEVELALWFHDAVYDVQAHDNERRSADWAVQALAQAGAADEVQRRVEALVMATCHDTAPTTPDQQGLVDIDLAILGAPPGRFAEYDQQVRAEYAWVPEPVYVSNRRQVLGGFLARASIYRTPGFQEQFEAQARRNLQSLV